MPLIGLLGGLTLATVAFLWATMRITLYWVQSGETAVSAVLDRLWDGYRVFVVAVVLLQTWDGLSSWAYDVWHWFGL